MDGKNAGEVTRRVDVGHDDTNPNEPTRRRERRLLVKIDLFVLPTVILLYLMCFIDRTNIGNARLAGLEKDLGLEGYDYNILLSVFYVSYVVFEIPAALCCKLIGPGWFLPLTSLGFGAMSLVTAFVQTRAQACAVRFLLGIFETGVMPGCAYYLSRWYKRSELTFRLGLWITMAPLSGAFGGLIASAILKLDSVGSLHGWQMIFAIEGIVTMVVALVAFVTLTDGPQTARWMTEEEMRMVIDRIKSERLNQDELLDKIDASKLKRGFSNPVTLAVSFIFLLDSITVLAISFFLPTIIRTIYPGRSVIQQQLLTVPPYIVAVVCTILITAVSWRMNSRQTLIALAGLFVAVGYAIFLATMNASVRYAAVFLCASTCFSLGAMTNAQVSANVLSDSARSIAIGTNVFFGYVGALIATWTYLPGDSPRYAIGNGINLGCAMTWTILAICTKLWMTHDNEKRDKKEAEAQLELTLRSESDVTNLEWKHPGWRWKP
ncbi:major facilitator superfamily domain-containing protein [Alternaria alternata]|nr:major facilitator superfamily domain-containing protein [Alternaria alternata]RYN53445.1 hypothetical protein AA0114_g4452 [Alternaria tenuissima]